MIDILHQGCPVVEQRDCQHQRNDSEPENDPYLAEKVVDTGQQIAGCFARLTEADSFLVCLAPGLTHGRKPARHKRVDDGVQEDERGAQIKWRLLGSGGAVALRSRQAQHPGSCSRPGERPSVPQ